MAFNQQPIQLPHPEEYLQKGPLLLTTFSADVQQYNRQVCVSLVRGQSLERIQVRAQPSPQRSPQRAQGLDQRRGGH